MNTNMAIGGAVLIALVAAYVIYQRQQADAARFAYDHSLGGAISNTIGGVGNIVGAAIGMAGNGSGSGSRQ